MKYIVILMAALLFQPAVLLADIFEDQLNTLKAQKAKATLEINHSYAEHLGILLEKVKANKDEAMAIKIRQEMFDAGFPHKDDWLLGQWEVSDSDKFVRTYTFSANGSARYTRFVSSWASGDPNDNGFFTKEPDGSYRVTLGKSLIFVSQGPRGGIVVTRWNDIKEYPDKAKSITGTAKR